MNEKEELLNGLKRWIFKANLYIKGYSFDQFLNDELVFDAVSYCIVVIDEISNKLINDYSEVINEEKDIDFKYLSSLKNNCFVNDNINVQYMFNAISNEFKKYIKLFN